MWKVLRDYLVAEAFAHGQLLLNIWGFFVAWSTCPVTLARAEQSRQSTGRREHQVPHPRSGSAHRLALTPGTSFQNFLTRHIFHRKAGFFLFCFVCFNKLDVSTGAGKVLRLAGFRAFFKVKENKKHIEIFP